MLCVGTALFGMFFFLTIFVQAVWGYSALRTGVAYLPMMAAIMAMSGASAQLVPRIGARPLLIAGSATAAGGMFWLSRIGEHSHYATGLLGPTLVAGAGPGHAVHAAGRGRAVPGPGRRRRGGLQPAQHGPAGRRLDRAGRAGHGGVDRRRQQHPQPAAAAAAAAGRGTRCTRPPARLPAAVYRHALATGFSRGFEVAAGILLLALIVTISAIRVRRADLAGRTRPTGQPGTAECVTPHRRCPEPSGRTPAVLESRVPLLAAALRRSSLPRGCALDREEGRNECLSWCTR